MSAPTRYEVAASAITKSKKVDVYLYNGEIARRFDLNFIKLIHESKKHDEAILFLVTLGGDPDAGYKISRYLQTTYDRHTVVVSGLCKSAGTLIAMGAHELAFAPYGELGPLDIQVFKTDNLMERQSGLTIQEALDSLSVAAVKKHGQVFSSIMQGTNGVVSFATAAKASAELVTGLFAPIFSQIDPYDVGDKARAMRIATDYGKRLSAYTNNLKNGTIERLTRTYPSHSFVIDFNEASELFTKTRLVTADEASLVEGLENLSRHEDVGASSPLMVYLPELKTENVTGTAKKNEEPSSPNRRRSAKSVPKNTRRTTKKTNPSLKNPRNSGTRDVAD